MTTGSKDINQKPVSGNPDTEPKFPDGSKPNNVPSEGSESGEIGRPGLDNAEQSRESRRPIDRSLEHAPDDTFPGSGPGR